MKNLNNVIAQPQKFYNDNPTTKHTEFYILITKKPVNKFTGSLY